MALETLRDFVSIGGFDVHRTDGPAKSAIFIRVNDEENSIKFRIQNGPIKENGVNGCQVDTIIETARIIIHGLNQKFPCRENSLAITKLEESLMWLKARKTERESRDVEGRNVA